ncbi:NAD(P)-binding Rossmann-fold containing protein [Glarea lozoyensis ATCC 20868]|uniref:NAD(P)-binding Rossmann-fold containing protein n=1 Tax=Glarea lozoyensis (strain ATCC 20868 / MF5171) TaxID=1116229 RepID=S3CR13_GLAL2|nr:NAD(P)-binding Rossmann-fold containing protein [Glarea lozoyensis ATCC 20868]EPE28115.1 NAD(P)-binding Rossmann-fold containing protein [Glarea lozoyensis ATCC 20868]
MASNILLLGASGYIGGSILTTLLKSKGYNISALVRKESQAEVLRGEGVKASVFEGLDDEEAIFGEARGCDIVIAAADARHAGAAKACLRGLAERQKVTGNSTSYTAGASMVADWPITGSRVDTSIHSDIDEDVYTLERSYDEPWSGVRDVNQIVVAFGEEVGVRTYIVIPPLIYGEGIGFFTKGFGQVSMYVDLALKHKTAVTLGEGSGIWSIIHINDLCTLYHLLVTAIINTSSTLKCGKEGYYYAESGSRSWKSIAEQIGVVGHNLGVFENTDVKTVEMKEVADAFYKGDERLAESVLGSNSRIKGDRARRILGWKPEFSEGGFEGEVERVVRELLEKEG